MLVGPGVEVKTVEGNAVHTDRNDGYVRAHLAVEAVLVHAEVGWGGAEADEAWRDGVGHRQRKRNWLSVGWKRG